MLCEHLIDINIYKIMYTKIADLHLLYIPITQRFNNYWNDNGKLPLHNLKCKDITDPHWTRSSIIIYICICSFFIKHFRILLQLLVLFKQVIVDLTIEIKTHKSDQYCFLFWTKMYDFTALSNNMHRSLLSQSFDVG